MIEINKIYNMDCLEGMKEIPDKSINMILCDLPYGTTQCKWDSIIPLDKLWEQYNRIITDNGAIVLTSDEPFTSLLITSNIKMYKTKWIWDKVKPNGFLNAKKQPLKRYEEVVVFYKKQCVYNPQMTKGKMRNKKAYNKNSGTGEMCYGKFENIDNYNDDKYPTNIIEFSNAVQKGKIHPTQKPVTLFEYLVKTYTNEQDTVLDNCMGSGTTAIACINTKRNYIGFELDNTYYNLSNTRIQEHLKTLNSAS